MPAAVLANRVSKSFQLKHSHTVRGLLSDRSKRRDPSSIVQALDSVSFRMDEGEGVAIMGANGSGKTTLLQLVCGILRPDTGTMHVRGQVAGLLGVSAGLSSELTGRENIYLGAGILGMTKSETDRKFDSIVDFAEFERFLDTPVKYYSSGMNLRLGFSIALHTEPDVFLVDEVLAVGDGQFKRKCREELLRRREVGLTLLMVAHETGMLRKMCTRGIVLEHGSVILDGTMEEAIALVGEDDEDALASVRPEFDSDQE